MTTVYTMLACRHMVKIGVRMNDTDVTGPGTAVQYGLIMLMCGC